ncbi:MAG: DNA-protecting protein DprA [Pedosphaera sp.]|nr:DNA-protecting protein DprA [Pedosphaera sp.]
MDSREALVALNLIEGVGPIRVRELMSHFGDAPAILSSSESQLRQVHRIGEETAAAIANWRKTVDLAAELRRVAESDCRIVTQLDDEYPELLRQIYDPPVVLYVKGRLEPQDKKSIAVVGSRMTTHYGTDTARKLGYQLAQAGMTIVSGGARGIDTAAHQGALAAGGRTIVVLGTGINIVFPPDNADLFERAASSGAVITQFPFNYWGSKQSFPIRNRIVAGMTLGTLVVEATLMSGALITAGLAVDNGRQVFAVPGRVDSPRSKGCHDLIKKGAKLCEDIEDVLSEFDSLFPANSRAGTAAHPQPSSALSDYEGKVFSVMDHEERSVDEVIRLTSLSAARVSVALLGLEMKRLVRQLPGKLFKKSG